MKWYGRKRAERLPHIEKQNIIVVDTETTGISPARNEILQITILDGTGSQLFNSYIQPSRLKHWKSAEKVNNITPEMVKDAPIFSEERAKIQKIFDNAKLVVGYNVNFDINFLEAAGVIVSADIFDVMYEFASFRQAIHKSPYRKCKLTECAQYFSYSYHAHSSENDTEATLYCFNQLISDQRFTSYKKNTSEVSTHKPRTSITFQRATARRRNIAVPGIWCIAAGELLLYFKQHILIASICQYVALAKDIISQYSSFKSEHAALILILLGVVLLGIGIIKWLARLPRWLVSSVRRIFNKLF